MATYFFSTTDGDDIRSSAAAQSSSTPWKTLAKLNSIFTTLLAGDTVSFKRGDTFPGTITVAKSGSSGNPINFNAYGSGAKPIITGLTTITGWASIGTNLWQTSAAIGTLARCNMVLKSGVFQPIGKWPTSGFPAGGATSGNIVNSNTGATQNAAASITSASLSGAPTANWATGSNSSAAEVVIRKTHWVIDRATITSQSGTTLNYINPTAYSAANGFGFLIQNHQAACDTQNEWWYDATTKKLGMFSVGSPTGIQASTVDTLVTVNAFAWLTFTNIVFEGSNTNTFLITTGNHLTFTTCDFQYAGFNGFSMQFNSTANITLTSCTATRINNNFITAQTSSGWTITDCTITDVGQVAGMGHSDSSTYNALSNIGPNSTVTGNTFTRIGYIAVDFRGNGSLIQHNFIDTFCNVKDDGSAIYTYTCNPTVTYTQRVIDHNIILNGGGAERGTPTTNWDAHGIYMDDNSSQVTISNNSIANCGGSGIFFHQSHALTVQGNNIYNCAMTGAGNYGQILFHPGICTSIDEVRNIIFTDNILTSRTASQIVASIQTAEADMSAWSVSPASTNWNNNIYCRPVAENASTFHVIRSSGTTNTNLAGWRSASGASLDAASGTTPLGAIITDVNKLRFEYNYTSGTVSRSLGSTYMDMEGASHVNSVSIPAYSSVTLVLTGSTPTTTTTTTAAPTTTTTTTAAPTTTTTTAAPTTTTTTTTAAPTTTTTTTAAPTTTTTSTSTTSTTTAAPTTTTTTTAAPTTTTTTTTAAPTTTTTTTSTSTSSTTTTTTLALVAITYPTVSGTLVQSPTGRWGSGYGYGIANKYLPANGFIQADYGGTTNQTAIIGLDLNNTLSDYSTFDYALYIQPSDSQYQTIANGVFSGGGVIALAGDKYRLIRTGSTIKAEYSRTNGQTWVTMKTFTATTSANLYVKGSIPTTAKYITNPKGYQMLSIAVTTTTTVTTTIAPLTIILSTKKNATCRGGANGSIKVTATGGTGTYLYSLNGGTYQGSSSFTSLLAGRYTVTVKDSNNTTSSLTVTIYDGFFRC